MTPSLELSQEPSIEMRARRFSVLSDPLRLRLLEALRHREKSVGMLADELQATQTNVSRHLSVLAQDGLLHRRKQAQQVFYSVAAPEIHMVCDQLSHSFEHRALGEAMTRRADLWVVS